MRRALAGFREITETGVMATNQTRCPQITEIRIRPFRETKCGNSMPCTQHAEDNALDALTDKEWFDSMSTHRPTSLREI